MGPGRGYFAHDFLAGARNQNPAFYEAIDYAAVEPGARQREWLRQRFAGVEISDKIRIARNLDEVDSVTGCLFSNELVDAFPVHVVIRASGKLREIFVTVEEDRLIEKMGKLSGTALAAAVARHAHHLDEGHRAEMSLRAAEWMRTVAAQTCARVRHHHRLRRPGRKAVYARPPARHADGLQ